MDDEQVLELRTWAQRLAADERVDVRAAGKAIVMLADELSALRAQQGLERAALATEPDPATTSPPADPGSADVASSLRTRLRSFVGVREAEPGRRSADERADSGHVHG